jgi:hypothetical protein
MGLLRVFTLGKKGVNVDKNPLEMDDDELRLAQNAIRDPLGDDSGVRKRPGFAVQNETTAAGIVMGGIGVPLLDESSFGTRYLYLGRGKDI